MCLPAGPGTAVVQGGGCGVLQLWAGKHGCAGRRVAKGAPASVTRPVWSPWIPVYLQEPGAEGCIWSWLGSRGALLVLVEGDAAVRCLQEACLFLDCRSE